MAAPKKKVAKRPDPIPVFASEAQIKSVKEEIRELEGMLLEDSQRKVPKIQDVGSVKAEILKKEQYVLRNSPSKLKGEAANKAYKEAKELEGIIKKNMPKGKSYHQPYPKSGASHLKSQNFEDAVRQQMAFQMNPQIKTAVLKYKNIMARLSGGDPHETNIERLRSGR